MSITASCGHELTKEEGLGITVAIKSHSKDCNRSVEFTTLCNNCLILHKNQKLILKTKQDQHKWLLGDKL